jgi:uncharacterized membrane protein
VNDPVRTYAALESRSVYERGNTLLADYPGWEHHAGDEHALWWFFMFLVFALLVGVIAALAFRWLAGRQQASAAALPSGAGGVGYADDALNIVRLRYARGEIDRDQFLQATADLGGGGTYPEPPPSEAPTSA